MMTLLNTRRCSACKSLQLPVDAFGRDQFFDLVELFAHQCQLLLRPIASDPVECRFQRIERGTAVFHEFAALQMVEKFVVFRIEQAPGNQEIQLAAIECAFDCGGIFDRGFEMTAAAVCVEPCTDLLTRHENLLLTSTSCRRHFLDNFGQTRGESLGMIGKG